MAICMAYNTISRRKNKSEKRGKYPNSTCTPVDIPIDLPTGITLI